MLRYYRRSASRENSKMNTSGTNTVAMPLLLGLIASATLSTACDDMSSPADLDREQVLAIRSTPSTLVAGESVLLDSLLAGPLGPFEGEIRWEIVDAPPGLSLSQQRAGATRLIADEGFTSEGPIEVMAAIPRPDGTELLALKRISVSQRAVENPQISALQVGGTQVGECEDLTLERGVVALQVEASADARVAWYASVGEIRYYRDAETSIETTDDDPSEGWLAVVIRNSTGGVDWRACEVHIR